MEERSLGKSLEGKVAPKFSQDLGFIVCTDTDNLAAEETAQELTPRATQVGWGEVERFNFNFRHNHFFKEQLEMKT